MCVTTSSLLISGSVVVMAAVMLVKLLLGFGFLSGLGGSWLHVIQNQTGSSGYYIFACE